MAFGLGWHILVVLLFLVNINTSAGSSTGDFTKPMRCSAQCHQADDSGPSKFAYESLKTYVYKYEGKSSGGLGRHESGFDNTMEYSGEVLFTWVSSCDVSLNIRNHSFKAIDQENSEFANQLSEFPLMIAMDNGVVTSVCPHIQEPTTILNFKKGLVSALQNSAPVSTSYVDMLVNETDILGNCEVLYTVYDNSSYPEVINIKKERDLFTCQGNSSFSYESQNPLTKTIDAIRSLFPHWLILLKPTVSTCYQEISDGIVTLTSCEDKIEISQPQASSHRRFTLGFVHQFNLSLINTYDNPIAIAFPTKFPIRYTDLAVEPMDKYEDVNYEEDINVLLRELCENVKSDLGELVASLLSKVSLQIDKMQINQIKNVLLKMETGSYCHNYYKLRNLLLDVIALSSAPSRIEILNDEKFNVDIYDGGRMVLEMLSAYSENTPSLEFLSSLSSSNSTFLIKGFNIVKYCMAYPYCIEEQEIKSAIQEVCTKIATLLPKTHIPVLEKSFSTMFQEVIDLYLKMFNGNSSFVEIIGAYSKYNLDYFIGTNKEERKKDMGFILETLKFIADESVSQDKKIQKLSEIYRNIFERQELPLPSILNHVAKKIVDEFVHSIRSFKDNIDTAHAFNWNTEYLIPTSSGIPIIATDSKNAVFGLTVTRTTDYRTGGSRSIVKINPTISTSVTQYYRFKFGAEMGIMLNTTFHSSPNVDLTIHTKYGKIAIALDFPDQTDLYKHSFSTRMVKKLSNYSNISSIGFPEKNSTFDPIPVHIDNKCSNSYIQDVFGVKLCFSKNNEQLQPNECVDCWSRSSRVYLEKHTPTEAFLSLNAKWGSTEEKTFVNLNIIAPGAVETDKIRLYYDNRHNAVKHSSYQIVIHIPDFGTPDKRDDYNDDSKWGIRAEINSLGNGTSPFSSFLLNHHIQFYLSQSPTFQQSDKLFDLTAKVVVDIYTTVVDDPYASFYSVFLHFETTRSRVYLTSSSTTRRPRPPRLVQFHQLLEIIENVVVDIEVKDTPREQAIVVREVTVTVKPNRRRLKCTDQITVEGSMSAEGNLFTDDLHSTLNFTVTENIMQTRIKTHQAIGEVIANPAESKVAFSFNAIREDIFEETPTFHKLVAFEAHLVKVSPTLRTLSGLMKGLPFPRRSPFIRRTVYFISGTVDNAEMNGSHQLEMTLSKKNYPDGLNVTVYEIAGPMNFTLDKDQHVLTNEAQLTINSSELSGTPSDFISHASISSTSASFKFTTDKEEKLMSVRAGFMGGVMMRYTLDAEFFVNNSIDTNITIKQGEMKSQTDLIVGYSPPILEWSTNKRYQNIFTHKITNFVSVAWVHIQTLTQLLFSLTQYLTVGDTDSLLKNLQPQELGIRW